MEYEIKQISLTSVLKVSFLVFLTVISISLMFATLLIARMADLLKNIDTTGGMDLLENINFNFFTIVFGSIFNGLFLTVGILFSISLFIIFYNLYAKYVGGIKLELKNSANNNLINTGTTND